jgi:uncharacterized SAM-binding protein YcdF (DUF218 family)
MCRFADHFSDGCMTIAEHRMTLFWLILILVAGGLCVMLKWRRTGHALLGVSVILFIVVGCGPLPSWVLGRLQSSYAGTQAIEWKPRNAIVLLGAGTERAKGAETVEPGMFSYGRIVKATELYNACRHAGETCKLVVTGGDPRDNGTSEAAVYRDTLERLGVNAADIVLEPNSMNTWQNAQFTSGLLKKLDADQVVLVSSGFHLRRGALYFAHFGVDAKLVSADHLAAVPSLLPLAYNFAVADLALHEYVGIIRYDIFDALGWNAARTAPGQA